MNDETATHTYQEDDTPTKPVGKPADGWVMPEPVFRKSSGGTLPRRLGLGSDDQAATVAKVESPSATNPPLGPMKSDETTPPAANVSEQPDLSADFSLPEDAVPAPIEKGRSGAAKILLIVLGVAGILLVIFVFLVVIYFLFFSRMTDSQTF